MSSAIETKKVVVEEIASKLKESKSTIDQLKRLIMIKARSKFSLICLAVKRRLSWNLPKSINCNVKKLEIAIYK